MQTQLVSADLPFLDAPPVPSPSLPSSVVKSAWRRRWLLARLLAASLLQLSRHWPGLRGAGRVLRRTLRLQQQFYGREVPRKVASVAGRHYREYHAPGWPSAAHAQYLAASIDRLAGTAQPLHTVYLAITKKCPLACAHCFEWEALNQRETLSRADLHELVARFQAQQVSQIYFSGGEPLLRLPDLEAVLRQARPGTDFWVITSGFHLTAATAQRLQAAGLTGVVVSLDHHEAAAHNAFRGSPQAYQQAVQGVAYARAAGLVVCLSVCVTREFATPANLWAYARLARQLGVAFINLLEPKAVGHYAGQDVALRPAHLAVLEAFYEQLAYDPAYRSWPLAYYYGYHQRRAGCAAVGNWFLYVDTDGDLHACPFCQRKRGSALGPGFEQALADLRAGSCPAFANMPRC